MTAVKFPAHPSRAVSNEVATDLAVGTDSTLDRWLINPILGKETGMIPDDRLDLPVLKEQIQEVRYGLPSASHEKFLPCDLPGQPALRFLHRIALS